MPSAGGAWESWAVDSEVRERSYLLRFIYLSIAAAVLTVGLKYVA